MDPAETIGAFGPRGHGLSPLGAVAYRHACQLVITALLTIVVVVVTIRDPGLLSPTASVPTIVAGIGGPIFLVRLELDAFAGALTAGISLATFVDHDPAVGLRATPGWLVLAAAGFLVGAATTWQFASGLVDVPVEWGHVTADSRQSASEFELLLPVAVGGGAAVVPPPLGLRHTGASSRQLIRQTRELSLLCLVTLAAHFSPPDSMMFTLYVASSAIGLGIAIAWAEFG